MTEPVGWGILGAGRISTVAVGPALAASPSCRLAAVGARDRDRAVHLADTLSDGTGAPAAAYGSYEQVVADPAVEAVYIALPNDAHVTWTLQALAAGKHVLCEKPFGLDLPQVRAAFDAAAASGLLAVEAAWNRWHPRTREAERIVASGAIGTVTAVDAGFTFTGVPPGDYRLDPSRGGGALYDVGCYALAAVGWATGWAEVSEWRPVTRFHPGGVDLAITGHLRLGAVQATVTAGIDEAPAQWLEITGTGGSLRFGPPAFSAWAEAPAVLELTGPDPSTGQRVFEACDPYLCMVEAVAGAIRGQDRWLVPRRDSEWVAAAIDVLRAGAGRLG